MMLGVGRLQNLERQGRAMPRLGGDTRNPMKHPVRKPKWDIPQNAVERQVQAAFSPRSLAGLGWIDDSVSRPDILAAVQAAASAAGWSVSCTEVMSTFPRTQYNRQCAVNGRPDLVFSADLIFDHAGGPNAGIQLALANSQDQGTNYTPPPTVYQNPDTFLYATPGQTTPPPRPIVPPLAPPAPPPAPTPTTPPTTNPAPQNAPAPTVQPGVVGAGTGTGNQTVVQTTDTTGGWIPGVSNTYVLIAVAAVAGLMLMKR